MQVLARLDDAAALTGRSLRHSVRSLDALLTALMLPVALLLLFVYVFGGAIETPGADYLDYIVPGILVLCVGFGGATTAVAVHEDMSGGMVDRLRSMPIAGAPLLVSHVVASVARNLVSTALVLALALVLGFGPAWSSAAWLAALGLLVLAMAAVSWAAAAWGLAATSVEAANAATFVAVFLPYVSSAMVPTDSMPGPLAWIAEHQPVTPVVETLRALLTAAPVDGTTALAAVQWCVGGLLAARVAAGALYARRTAR